MSGKVTDSDQVKPANIDIVNFGKDTAYMKKLLEGIDENIIHNAAIMNFICKFLEKIDDSLNKLALSIKDDTDAVQKTGVEIFRDVIEGVVNGTSFFLFCTMPIFSEPIEGSKPSTFQTIHKLVSKAVLPVSTTMRLYSSAVGAVYNLKRGKYESAIKQAKAKMYVFSSIYSILQGTMKESVQTINSQASAVKTMLEDDWAAKSKELFK